MPAPCRGGAGARAGPDRPGCRAGSPDSGRIPPTAPPPAAPASPRLRPRTAVPGCARAPRRRQREQLTEGQSVRRARSFGRPRQEVLHQGLCTEAHRDAEDAGRRDQRGDVEPELGQDHQERHGREHPGREALQDRGHRVRPLLAPLRQQRAVLEERLRRSAGEYAGKRPLGRPPGQPGDEPVQDRPGHDRQQDDQQDERRLGEQPVGPLGKPWCPRPGVDPVAEGGRVGVGPAGRPRRRHLVVG